MRKELKRDRRQNPFKNPKGVKREKKKLLNELTSNRKKNESSEYWSYVEISDVIDLDDVDPITYQNMISDEDAILPEIPVD